MSTGYVCIRKEEQARCGDAINYDEDEDDDDNVLDGLGNDRLGNDCEKEGKGPYRLSSRLVLSHSYSRAQRCDARGCNENGRIMEWNGMAEWRNGGDCFFQCVRLCLVSVASHTAFCFFARLTRV